MESQPPLLGGTPAILTQKVHSRQLQDYSKHRTLFPQISVMLASTLLIHWLHTAASGAVPEGEGQASLDWNPLFIQGWDVSKGLGQATYLEYL